MRHIGDGRHCRTEAGDGGQRRGAATPAAFLPAAGNQGGQSRVFFRQQQRADALRPAELMGRQRQTMGTKSPQIDRHTPPRLHRIHMQQGAGGAAKFCRPGNRLQRAGLVVRQHQTHQGRRALGQHRRQGVEIGHAIAVHR